MDSISSNTTVPSALQNKQEVVASPAAAGSRNVKAGQQARQQQQADRPRPEQEKGLLCPRCPSTNTKFCYYNNYSVTQPRYFCKACRRYWTLGGTLRSVPVGGGCRKNKQNKAAAASSSSEDDSATATATNKKKKMDDISQHLMMMPTATAPMPADFPNVLPTFMSTSPTGGLPFAGTTFLDMMPFLPAPSFGVMLQHGHAGMMMGDLQGVDHQEVKPPVPAGEGAPSVQEEPQQVAADNNNSGPGSIINYWQL